MSDSSTPIASPFVEIRVPLETLNQGLAQAEQTVAAAGERMGAKLNHAIVDGAKAADVKLPVEELEKSVAQAETVVAAAGDRMGTNMSASLVNSAKDLGQTFTFNLLPAIDDVTGQPGSEAAGGGASGGKGMKGFNSAVRAGILSMSVLGMRGNEALGSLSIALSQVAVAGFDPLNLAIAGAFAGLSYLVSSQAAAAAEAKHHAAELTALNSEIRRTIDAIEDLRNHTNTLEVNNLDERRLAAAEKLKEFFGYYEFKSQGGGLAKAFPRTDENAPSSVPAGAEAAMREYNAIVDLIALKKQEIAVNKELDQSREETRKFLADYERQQADREARARAATEKDLEGYVDPAAGVADAVLKKKQETDAALAKAREALRKELEQQAKDRQDQEDQDAQDARDREQRQIALQAALSSVELKGQTDRVAIIENAARAEMDAIDARYSELLQQMEENGEDQTALVQAIEDAKQRIRDRADARIKYGVDQDDPTRALARSLAQMEMTQSERAIDEATRKWQEQRNELLANGRAVDVLDEQYMQLIAHLRQGQREDEEFWAGFAGGVRDAQAGMDKLGGVGAGVAGDLRDGFGDVFASARDGAKGMEDAVVGALDAIQDRLARFVGDQAFNAFFGKADSNGNLTGGIAGALGNLLGISLGGGPDRVGGLHTGNVDALVDDAVYGDGTAGGVVAKMAGGGRRGGDTVVLHNKGEPMKAAKAERRQGPDGEELHITLEKMMAASIARGGAVTQALEQRYPLEVAPRHR